MLGKTSESELSDHLYDLIYELNAIAPSVLLAVLPQLEFKLKVSWLVECVRQKGCLKTFILYHKRCTVP